MARRVGRCGGFAGEQLQAAIQIDLGDHLTFRIEEAQVELAGAPLGGARFPCEAFLAGKTYGRFHIDLGFSDEIGGSPDALTGDDLLAFAGIPPAHVLAVPRPQQFAEEVHAYTRPWTDRLNMRSKGLVDLALLIGTGSVEPPEVAQAVRRMFAKRNTHAIPPEPPDPPTVWSNEFPALAAEARLAASTPSAAIQTLRDLASGHDRFLSRC